MRQKSNERETGAFGDCTIMVTGGNGFIGSNFIRSTLALNPGILIVNVDKLTYAGSKKNLTLNLLDDDPIDSTSRLTSVVADIRDSDAIEEVLSGYAPKYVVHFAAETHVDNSIAHPDEFVTTNVNGTFELLERFRHAVSQKLLPLGCRFLHVSTDEVFGSLSEHEPPSTERSRYAPRSVYSATKASSDHLVMAAHATHGVPTIVTNCSNNYGPRQHKEKFIPKAITNMLHGEPVPVYGKGEQVRDWIHVQDHCSALRTVLAKGEVGRSYNVGGGHEMRNIDLVSMIAEILGKSVDDENVVRFVVDRPGHDLRYSVNCHDLRMLGWTPRVNDLRTGLRSTIDWYAACERLARS